MSISPKIISHISASPNVSRYLLDIREFCWMNQDTDLVLVSGLKSVEIHQSVILPLSSFLRGIVPSSCPCLQPAIILPPVPPDVLDALVELLYLGKSTPSFEDVQDNVEELLALLWINADIYRDQGGEDFNAGENQNEETVNDSGNNQPGENETKATVNDSENNLVAKRIVPMANLPSLSGRTQSDVRMTGRKRNAMEPDDNRDKKVRKGQAEHDSNLSVKNPDSSSKDKHNKKAKYCCDVCDSKFVWKRDLKRHIESIHDNIKYPCNQCDYQATTRAHLIRHIESIHEKVKYPCNQCDYQATQRTNLIKHIESIHEKVKYPCNQCDYQATQRTNLITHITSIHENIKWRCDQCHHRATTCQSLIRHVKVVHGKVSPASDQRDCRATRKSTRSTRTPSIYENSSNSSDLYDPRPTRNTRQLRQTYKRVPDSDVNVMRLDRNVKVRTCDVKIKRSDLRRFRCFRNCEVRILRISPDERIAGSEIGQRSDFSNGTNEEIEEITSDDEQDVPRNDGNEQSTALVVVGTGANEVIEEIPREENIEEVPRNDDDDIRLISFSVTVTKVTKKTRK